MEVASLSSFRSHPERFYKWFRPLAKNILEASPNPAHLAISNLEKVGIVKEIITQNIDGLHQRAGSQVVIEVHGTMDTLNCGYCSKIYPIEAYIRLYINEGIFPTCPKCEDVLKPNVILFEEQLNPSIWQAAENAACSSDVMLVVGSSLEVMPVAGLPLQTLANGGKIIVVNTNATYLDDRAQVVLHQDAAIALPQIMEYVSRNSN